MTTEALMTKNVGERLREQRLEQEKTLEDIARRLHFSEVQLTHLEQAEYSLLPSLLVIRGMIRSYAQLLGIDGDDLIHAFEMECPNEATKTHRLVLRHGIERPIVIPSRNPILTQGLSLLGFGAIILIALFWWGIQKLKHSVPEVKVTVEKSAASLALPSNPAALQSSIPNVSARAASEMKSKSVGSSSKESSSLVNSNLEPVLEKPRDHENLRYYPRIVESPVVTDPVPSEEKPVIPIIAPQ